MLGIIGGSGFYTLKGKSKMVTVKTPYGNAEVRKTKIFDKEAVFVPRHGKGHAIPPHKVNYKANIYALKKLGVTGIIGIYATGIISKYKPGELILAEDFLGFWTPVTFFDDFSDGIKHVDFSQPYDKELNNLVLGIARAKRIKIKTGGIIATMVGPRFETKAEIKALRSMGANLVSMTHSYEAALIGELEIPYVGLAIGTNYACGITKKKLNPEEVIGHMSRAEGRINDIIEKLIKESY